MLALKVVATVAVALELPAAPPTSLMNCTSLGPILSAMNRSPWSLGCTPSLCSMALVKPAAREQSAMAMGDCEVVCACAHPGMAVFMASMVVSLQLVGMSLST